MNKDFGGYLKHSRKLAGLKLFEAARKLKMNSAQHLWNIESGRSPIQPKYLKPVSKAYNISLEVLVMYLVDSYQDALKVEVGLEKKLDF